MRVYDLIRLLDRYGAPHGHPPSTLTPVIEQFDYAHGTDVWGREIHYRYEEQWYAVRSAGPDGEFHTSDDIFGWGRLGLSDPCGLRQGERVIVADVKEECSDPPPSLWGESAGGSR
jgi:hypothetical protein